MCSADVTALVIAGLPALRQPMPTSASVRRSHVVLHAAAQDISDDQAFWDTQETDAQVCYLLVCTHIM